MQGVVTEDSDVLLFGAKCVYRHMFEDKKYVEVCIIFIWLYIGYL